MTGGAPRAQSGVVLRQHDTRSVEELIEKQLEYEARGEDEWADNPAAILHARGTRDVLDAAVALRNSPNWERRRLAANIFGQLGSPERTFPEECCDALLGLLDDPNGRVRLEAVFAFGHLGNRRADPALIALRIDPDDDIRYGVAFSLCGATSPEAVAALLELMDDPYELARDWATHSIGAALEIDGEHIRAALLKRCDDDDVFTRGEALCALARRKDARVVPFLLRAYDTRVELFEDHAREAVAIFLEDEEASGNEAMWFEALNRRER